MSFIGKAIIREITTLDLPTIAGVLSKGFPARASQYWRRDLDRIHLLPEIENHPLYGYMIEQEGVPQGVLLCLATSIEGHIRTNISSWYVAPQYRPLALPLMRQALQANGGTYTILSPDKACEVPRIIEHLGFVPYVKQSVRFDAYLALAKTNGWRVVSANGDRLPVFFPEFIERQKRFGCGALLANPPRGTPRLLIYKVQRAKYRVPCAQFVYGSPDTLLDAAPAIMRALVRRGIPLMQFDIDVPCFGKTMQAASRPVLRYARGAAPDVGDHLDSELAVFGG